MEKVRETSKESERGGSGGLPGGRTAGMVRLVSTYSDNQDVLFISERRVAAEASSGKLARDRRGSNYFVISLTRMFRCFSLVTG